MRRSWVYMMTNQHHNVLYVGVTSNIEQRVLDHKGRRYPHAFTAQYNCHKLVWFEEFGEIVEAMAQEKRMKRWRRAWKEELIGTMNPEWKDLSEGWYDPGALG
ncbi:MAG TPA: GIY-YIG nuclease family protein [Flavobacteriales bacterium]|nr:GIY-YIG nuclease family protein [Flavobacteriales bacterium]HMR26172.1 GIY-YIG nuclease family protein [Flavobacteriales bacterium]